MGEQVRELLDNVFTVPEPTRSPTKSGNAVDSYRKRYQLLDYDDVMKLSDVMETAVPVDGKGNFPSLYVTPCTLVQMVRDGLSEEGIRVPNVRLNGSAATHVLCGDGEHQYKDLDLIFAVDLSEYGDVCNCFAIDFNINVNNNNSTYCRTKGLKAAEKKPSSRSQVSAKLSPVKVQPVHTDELQLTVVADPVDPKISGANDSSGNESTSCSVSTATILEKSVSGEDEFADAEDKESGYISSGSSVSGQPHSPAGSWVYQNTSRSRTHSFDSSSSITSSSSIQHAARHKEGTYLDVRNGNARTGYTRDHIAHHEHSKDSCWQKIKGVVMSILRDLLPEGVIKFNMTDAMLTDAYVQKMVKITNDVDKWSLISLNNNAGRNLELKFVETMRRQYEFSVDSFQIILDSYQRSMIVLKALEESNEVEISPNFYPSVLAESVYGDFEAALRHLRHRRICTRRPEEIRGGGLLRYCNLLVRDFTPGEVEGHEDDVMPDESCQAPLTSHNGTTEASYSTSKPEDIQRLERLMCSRFFIDFSDITRQQQKLLSYMDSHFADEDDLKFQYLLHVRHVVDKNTVCLMAKERSQIVDFIKDLALDTLAIEVNRNPQIEQVVQPNQTQVPPCCFSHEKSRIIPQYQQTTHCYSYQHPNQPPLYPPQWTQCCNNINNSYPPYVPQPNYASGCNFYPQQPAPPLPMEQPFNSHCEIYPVSTQKVPIALCPCCRCTYPQVPTLREQCGEAISGPQVVVTPPEHKTMSVNSPPFYPASRAPKTYTMYNNDPTNPSVVFLDENATYIYSASPPPVCSGQRRQEPAETGASKPSLSIQ